MKLLLITGAGASRNLNVLGTDPIALMDGWADALRRRFGPDVSRILGLDRVTTGQEFEELLGELTRWLQLKDLNMRFAPMLSQGDRYSKRKVTALRRSLENAEKRGETLEAALDDTLIEQFGSSRFDAEGSARGYDYLLRQIHKGRPDEFICATTNYDRSLEIALGGMDFRARTGFSHDGFVLPSLSLEDLGTFAAQPSVLHLHGAVGWHRSGGSIVEVPLVNSNHPEISRPAVLYPTKNKVVEDSIVAGVWSEFDRALESATHIFVLGHGLGDNHLVARLRNSSGPLAVSVHPHRVEDEERIHYLLPRARVIKIDFSRTPRIDSKALLRWLRDSELMLREMGR